MHDKTDNWESFHYSGLSLKSVFQVEFLTFNRRVFVHLSLSLVAVC